MTTKKPGSNQNPQIEEWEVGIREVKSLKVYPLSIGQQIKASDMIEEALAKFFGQQITNINKEVVSFVLDTVIKNVKQVIAFVTDPEDLSFNGYSNVDNLLDDVSNNQFSDFISLIKEMNYDELLKNLKGPLKRMLTLLPSEDEISALKGPSQESATSTQATD